jgi:putative protein-disulfide isomerase
MLFSLGGKKSRIHGRHMNDQNPAMFTLYYYHDPMCSWCWGYRPTAEILFANLPPNTSRENVLGGLASDSDEPMPVELRRTISGHWRKIQETLGAEFNFDFWTKCTPRRSTYPACRAVIAAANQQHESEMILAIQRAYYLRAMNPSDTDILEAPKFAYRRISRAGTAD